MITANNLIDRFRQFAESHYFIRTFSFGDPSEIDITKLPEPPLMHVTYLGARYAPGLKVYSLEVYILDQPPITVAKQEYQQETVSDAEQCAEDVLADMEAGHNVFDFEFTVENASATPLRENASGLFAGVLLDLEVGVPYNNEACFAPLDGVQPGTDEQVYQRRGLLKVITEDGSVDVPSVNTIRVTNGTLTDNGSGVVTLDIGTSTGGAGQLNELDDVAITSPTQGQVLQYNATDGEWQNAAANLPATTDDLPEGTTNQYYTDARVSANANVVANTAKNSYPTADATKLAGIEEGAQANVNADWNAASGDAQILNKPTLFSGDYNHLTNKPPIPQDADDIAPSASRYWFTPLEQLKLQSVAYNAEPNVNADWNATSGDAQILNKPSVPANIGDLGDVPLNMGSPGQVLAVDSAGTALEYVTQTGGGGGVNSVTGGYPIVITGTASDPVVNVAIVSSTANGAMRFGDKNKLDAIEAGAQVNVQSDWNATGGDALILNKPAIPKNFVDLSDTPSTLGTPLAYARTNQARNAIEWADTLPAYGQAIIATSLLPVTTAFAPVRPQAVQKDELSGFNATTGELTLPAGKYEIRVELTARANASTTIGRSQVEAYIDKGGTIIYHTQRLMYVRKTATSSGTSCSIHIIEEITASTVYRVMVGDSLASGALNDITQMTWTYKKF